MAQALARITADMDPATLAMARRHDPRPHTTYWGRVPGWERIDLSVLPSLGFDSPAFADAQAINANIPIADAPQPAPAEVAAINAALAKLRQATPLEP